MLVIPGQRGIDDCDGIMSRRELLRVGGSSVLGLTLADVLRQQAQAKSDIAGGPGFAKAKSVLLV